MIRGVLVEGKVLIKDASAASELENKGYGTRINGVFTLNLIEATYLVDKGNLQVVNEEGENLSFSELARIGAQMDRYFWPKLSVYTDLRQRGLKPRLFSDRLEFLVDKKVKEGEHRYLISILFEGHRIGFTDIEFLIKRALEARRKLVAAIMDKEGNISYYTIDKVTY